jgi:elongation factor P
MFSTSDIRKGLKIEINGEPFAIVDFLHVKPGKGGAFIRTKLKNLKTGAVLDKTFRSGEKFAKADLEEKDMQYLYNDGESYHFMDNETYEQISLPEDKIEFEKNFLKENVNVKVLFFKGDAISVEIPTFVELEVTHTEPGLKGDTASSASKPATVETGYTLNVPLFVNMGDILKIDTRTGEYVERVKK